MEISVALFVLAVACLLARYAFSGLHRSLQTDALLIATGFAAILGRLSVCLAVATILPDTISRATARGIPNSVTEAILWSLAWLPPILLLILVAWQVVIVGVYVWIDSFGAETAKRERTA